MAYRKEVITSAYTARELYDLVLDIESYPDFLPWVAAARILSKEDNLLYADLVIKFKSLQEKYTSKVVCMPATDKNATASIKVDMVEGPFQYLYNHWHFTPITPSGTTIEFEIDFAFQSKLLNMILSGLFEQATRKMIAAFISRAEKTYGPRS